MQKDNSINNLKTCEKKIFISIFLVSLVLIIKLFGGFLSNSLALLSDSLHLITDVIALIISWLGLRLANKPANHKYTFGHYRHSIFAAFINNIMLISISFFILYKAILRYLHPVPVESILMMIFSVIGLIVNTIILMILKGDTKNINVKTAFFHFISDIVGDGSVLLGAFFIYLTNLSIIDTLLSAILSILILRNAVKMMIECIHIFLEGTPHHINLIEIKNSVIKLEGVTNIKDLHVWSLSEEILVMTAHITIDFNKKDNQEEIIHDIQHLLMDQFNICHSTLQIEHLPCSSCFHNKPDHKGTCTLCIDSIHK